MWKQTADTLVLIDRGTPSGFNIITTARQQILDLCAKDSTPVHVVAPVTNCLNQCPHEKKCPLVDNDYGQWCHFSQKVQNNQLMRTYKRKKSSQEDVKYSYVILRKQKRPIVRYSEITTNYDDFETAEFGKTETLNPAKDLMQNSPWPILILPPLKRVKHVTVDLCTAQGTFERTVIAKSHPKPLYSHMRKTYWGDLWPHKFFSKLIPRVKIQNLEETK